MRFRHRSFVAWIALLGILFSQLALSAYACPQLLPANQPAQMASHGDMPDMAGMPCADMDPAQPLMCAQYGQQGDQTVGSNLAFDFHPVLGLLLVAPTVSQAGTEPESALQAPLLARATSPPPLSSSRRLRI